MNSYVKDFSNKMDFLEFKQSILFLKQPQHKASIFYELTLDKFLEIREFTFSVEEKIQMNERYTINDYEKDLFIIWPTIKAYPSSSTLVAKALMQEDNFSALFKYSN